MQITNFTDLVPIWGAALATILAIIRIYEFWRDRSRIEIEIRTIISGSESETTITIYNLSNRPIIISYWRFYRQKYSLWRCNSRTVKEAEFDSNPISISEYSNIELTFTDPEILPVGTKFYNNFGRLVLKLKIAGSRLDHIHRFKRDW